MPDSPEDLQAVKVSKLYVLWLITISGSRYEFPDMTKRGLDAVLAQLDGSYDNLTVINVNMSYLIISKALIKRVGVGERCMWGAS